LIPPQDPVYQNQLAFVPNPPPVMLSVELEPEQIREGVPEAVVASIELEDNITEVLIQSVELHKPSARIK
jgi:hypothetical protein